MIALSVAPFLAACDSFNALRSNADETFDGVRQVMSGGVLHPAAIVDDVLEDVEAVRADVERRVDNVSTGIQAIQEGQQLIRAGLSGSGSVD